MDFCLKQTWWMDKRFLSQRKNRPVKKNESQTSIYFINSFFISTTRNLLWNQEYVSKMSIQKYRIPILIKYYIVIKSFVEFTE